MAPEVAASDNKVGIMTTLGFQCMASWTMVKIGLNKGLLYKQYLVTHYGDITLKSCSLKSPVIQPLG